jgi:hypothetical protein
MFCGSGAERAREANGAGADEAVFGGPFYKLRR